MTPCVCTRVCTRILLITHFRTVPPLPYPMLRSSARYSPAYRHARQNQAAQHSAALESFGAVWPSPAGEPLSSRKPRPATLWTGPLFPATQPPARPAHTASHLTQRWEGLVRTQMWEWGPAHRREGFHCTSLRTPTCPRPDAWNSEDRPRDTGWREEAGPAGVGDHGGSGWREGPGRGEPWDPQRRDPSPASAAGVWAKRYFAECA